MKCCCQTVFWEIMQSSSELKHGKAFPKKDFTLSCKYICDNFRVILKKKNTFFFNVIPWCKQISNPLSNTSRIHRSKKNGWNLSSLSVFQRCSFIQPSYFSAMLNSFYSLEINLLPKKKHPQIFLAFSTACILQLTACIDEPNTIIQNYNIF